METLVRDLRDALSMMRRNKGFAAAGLLTLALGLGATTALFSVVYGVLFRPLPYPEAHRLVRLSEEHPGATSPLRQPMLSNLTYHAWQESRTIEQFAAYSSREYTVAAPEGASRLTGAAVTPSLLGLLGQSPALGRFFLRDEGAAGRDAFIVLSDRGWRQHFHTDPAIVGRGLVVDGKPFVVVGVARPGFSFPDRETLFWTPMEVRQPSADAVAGQRGAVSVLNALARLRPGMSPQQAEAEGTAAARTTVRPMAANLLFGAGGPPVVHVRSLIDEMTMRVRPALLVLSAAVVCVLLIACANVGNLFLSRGVARQRELAVRAALGAGRGRLVRQLLTESVVFSVLGGAMGVALASALIRLVRVFAARDFPRLDALVIDARVTAFAAAAALVTAVLSGFAPALRGARFDLAESLHGGDGASTGGFRGLRARRLRDSLLVIESAFAVLLLVAATLLARSFVRLTNVDAGYTADNALAAHLFLPGSDTPDKGEAVRALVDAILQRARAMPDVVAAGATNMMPLDNSTAIAGFPSPWTPVGADRRTVRSLQYVITPGYAEAIGLRLKKGRFFVDADFGSAVRPWIVNEEFARLYLPPDPIGHRWIYPATPTSPERINEVIGIAGNTLKNGNDTAPQPEHYQLPRAPMRFYGGFEIVVRTAGDPLSIAPALRGLLREMAPTAAVQTVMLSQRAAEAVDQPRFAMTVLAAIATLALALASVGLYGVLSYGVSQRRRELGVRAALGASRSTLVRLVIREGLGVTAVGLVVGLGGAAATTRLMQGVLFGVTPLDAWSFLAAPAVLLPIALGACALPAHRAASTDPAEALRIE